MCRMRLTLSSLMLWPVLVACGPSSIFVVDRAGEQPELLSGRYGPWLELPIAVGTDGPCGRREYSGEFDELQRLTTHRFDDAGRRIESVQRYVGAQADGEGKVLQRWTWTYDDAGQLSSHRHYFAGEDEDHLGFAYEYDAGQLVRQVITQAESRASKEYQWEDGRIVGIDVWFGEHPYEEAIVHYSDEGLVDGIDVETLSAGEVIGRRHATYGYDDHGIDHIEWQRDGEAAPSASYRWVRNQEGRVVETHEDALLILTTLHELEGGVETERRYDWFSDGTIDSADELLYDCGNL